MRMREQCDVIEAPPLTIKLRAVPGSRKEPDEAIYSQHNATAELAVKLSAKKIDFPQQ